MGTLSAGLSYKVVIMATTFEKRNYCATALALVVFGLTVAAAVVDWYAQADVYHRSTDSAASRSASNPDSLIDTSELNFTKVRYDLEGFTVESKTSAGTIDKDFFTYNSRTGSDVRNVFKTSQAFVIIALVIAFVLSVLLSLFLLPSPPPSLSWFSLALPRPSRRSSRPALRVLAVPSSIPSALRALRTPTTTSSTT